MRVLMFLLLLQLSCGLQDNRKLNVRGHLNNSSSDDAIGQGPGSDDLEEPSTSNGDDVDSPNRDDNLPEFPNTEDPEGEKLFTFTYPVKDYLEHSQQFYLTADKYENRFKLDYNYKTMSNTFTQKILETKYQSFTQGSDSKSHTDDFSVSGNAVVDLLLVVDNSPSMKDERDRVAQLLPQLTSYLTGLDWRIAVTTTDEKDGPILAYIDSKDMDPSGAFERAVSSISTRGSRTERGIYKAKIALRSGNWLRSSSDIAVLFVSDEDNCSTGTGCERAF